MSSLCVKKKKVSVQARYRKKTQTIPIPTGDTGMPRLPLFPMTSVPETHRPPATAFPQFHGGGGIRHKDHSTVSNLWVKQLLFTQQTPVIPYAWRIISVRHLLTKFIPRPII